MTKSYPIKGKVCVSCAARAEKKIAELPGVESARVNALTKKVTLEAAPDCFPGVALEADRILRREEDGASLVIGQ
ncbi:MAG: heavy-metal-associated domain-containing protein [Eubacteriales bacterium]|nr:heavy-metal-associated domain-containing protein [Eubacteriales bacterium]